LSDVFFEDVVLNRAVKLIPRNAALLRDHQVERQQDRGCSLHWEMRVFSRGRRTVTFPTLRRDVAGTVAR